MDEKQVEIVSGVLVLNEKKELLLVRGPKFTSWVVPGGHVDFGEKLEDCAKRELKEETGIECNALQLVCVNEDLHKIVRGRERHFVFLNYSCTIENPKVRLEARELTESKWVPLSQVESHADIPESLKEPVRVLLGKKS